MAEPVAYYNDNWTLTPRAYEAARKELPELFADMKPAFASPPVAVQEEGDAKDAARYRWLRDRPLDWSVQHERNGWSTCYGRNELDAQIDAAMKGDQP